MSSGAGRFASLETEGRDGGDGRDGRDGRAAPPPRKAQGAPLRNADYYLAEAAQHELAGNHEKALTSYSSALGENPLAVRAWVGQLWMLLYLEEPAEAALWSDKALAAFPDNPDLLALKALALWRAGRFADGSRLIDAALMGRQDSGDVWLARGEIQLGGTLKAAHACFLQALNHAVDRDTARLRVADLYRRANCHASALAAYAEATRNLPESAWAWYGYGLMLREDGNDAGAVNAFRRAVRLAPERARYEVELKRRVGLLGALWQTVRRWWR